MQKAKNGLKTALRLTTIATMVMLASSTLIVPSLAAVNINWLPSDTGIQLASEMQESITAITKTSDNYFVVAWADDRTEDWDIYVQKLDGEGAEQWTAGGIALVTGTGNQPSTTTDKFQLEIVADTSGGAIIAWSDENDSNHLYLRKITSTGTTSWTATITTADLIRYELLADGSGGAYAVWEDNVETGPSTGFFSRDIYASHIVGTDGSQNWNSGQPVSVAVTTDDEANPTTVLAGDGIVITYRFHYFSGPDEYFGIQTTKLTTSGTVSGFWSPYVTTVTPSMTAIDHIASTPDGADGAIVTYQHNATDIKAQRVGLPPLAELAGKMWGTDGVDICNATGTQSEPGIMTDNNNNAIIAWQDTRSGTQAIYAQKVDSTGSTAWAVNGIAISNETYPQYFPRIVSNGASGAIIFYVQTDVALTRSDLKAQLLDSSGSPQWGAGGTFAETNSSTVIDLYPAITGNDNGGAAVSWIRETTLGGASTIHAQYLTDSSGGLCLEPGSDSFCGTQVISSSTLTFTDIPDSFNFGTLQSGATNHACINGSNIASPSYICSTDLTPVAGVDDMLKVYDDRNSGGFLVNLSPGANTFTDGTNTIPLTNLYVLTTLPETPVSGFNENGVTYDGTGETGISAPAYVNEFTPDFVDISDPDEYTTRSAASQFGGGSVVLMDGTLSESVGRSGYFSQYINYYLKVDPNQAAGNYALLLTFDLMDSTTL